MRVPREWFTMRRTMMVAALFVLIAVLFAGAVYSSLPRAMTPDPRLLRLPDYGVTVVTFDGRRQNDEARQQFLLAYEARRPARWKLNIFTTEGDPVIYTLFYDGGDSPVHVAIDSTRDKFGARSITKCQCDDIQQDGPRLRLTGCTGSRELGPNLTLP